MERTMTAYINWAAYTQAIKGDAFQTQGNNVADYETVLTTATSSAAPEGAQYASVYCDVNTKIEANIISQYQNTLGETIYNAKETFCGAGERIEVPNVVVGVTTLTVTDV